VLVFEMLAERTLALPQLEHRGNPERFAQIAIQRCRRATHDVAAVTEVGDNVPFAGKTTICVGVLNVLRACQNSHADPKAHAHPKNRRGIGGEPAYNGASRHQEHAESDLRQIRHKSDRQAKSCRGDRKPSKGAAGIGFREHQLPRAHGAELRGLGFVGEHSRISANLRA
jgi:hypothetical protein